MGLITLVMSQFGNGNPLKGHNGGGVKGIRWKRWLALSWDRSSWPVVAGGAKLPTCIFNQSRLAGDTKLWRGGETAKGGEKNRKGGPGYVNNVLIKQMNLTKKELEPGATLKGMVLFLSICREGAPLALRDQVPPSVQALGFLQFLLQGTSG
ncbi:hypothetical protein Ancab_038844 [Ancistrocladus abbreviatus]